jgi:hypothetical protein
VTTTFTFAPATREQAKARIALEGPSGSGKTYTALTLGTAMADRVALIDTERGSASKYALGSRGNGFTFDTLQMTKFDPRDLVGALAAAGQAGYGCVIVDSLSHFWMGQGGMLELVDNIGRRSGSGGNWGGWKEAKPHERAMIDALLAYPGHVIVTMRTKSEWVVQENDRGKKEPKKIGLKAEQRDGIEFEFDLVGDMDQENTLVVTKSRCPDLSGAVINRPTSDLAVTVLEWLSDGVEAPDASVYVDSATGLTTVVAGRELYAEVERRRLLGAAMLHPATGQPTTLGEYIIERGRQLRAAEQQAGAPAPAGPSPARQEPEQPAPGQDDQPPAADRPAPAQGEAATAPQMRKIHAQMRALQVAEERDRQLAAISMLLGIGHIGSRNELTFGQASQLIEELSHWEAMGEDGPAALRAYLNERAGLRETPAA